MQINTIFLLEQDDETLDNFMLVCRFYKEIDIFQF